MTGGGLRAGDEFSLPFPRSFGLGGGGLPRAANLFFSYDVVAEGALPSV